MIKAMMHATIRRFERSFGYDASYMHEMVGASAAAGARFMMAQSLSRYRKGVPKDALYAAAIAATLSEDCGPCTQINVDLALRDGIAPAKLAALLRGDIEQAGDDAAFGYRYGMAVANNRPEVLELVDAAEQRYGARGKVSLAMAVAYTRVFPALKRGLGHGAACSKIEVGDQMIAIRLAA